jgi:isopentenyl-diphosphate delta-isomerase
MIDANANDLVVLVDADDNEIGTAGKLAAHRSGARHRAISVQIVDRSGRLLLQKRSPSKYHSGGLWTNTCCSHPRPGESTADAAERRLSEEMGIRAPLKPLFRVHYRAELDSGMIENEIVHVLGGIYSGPVAPDPLEAETFEWSPYRAVRSAVEQRPDEYSVWFRIYLRDHDDAITRLIDLASS